MKVRLSLRAKRDLMEIGLFIAEDSATRAESFISELETACQRLVEAPLGFPLLESHRRAKIRRRPYGDYLIFYVVQDANIQIVRILHGARDYENILFSKPD